MIELQHIIESKREVLSRETYSRTPINYSEGMSDDQKDRFIQYLAEQHQEDELTKRAMQQVLEDFMSNQKLMDEKLASMEARQSELEGQLAEERKLRKTAERKGNPFKKSWIMPIRNVSVTDARESEREQLVEILKSQHPIVKTRKITLTVPRIL